MRPGRVLDREYYGHDRLIKLRLDPGTQLQSHLLGLEGDFVSGQRVDLQVRDQVVVYPA